MKKLRTTQTIFVQISELKSKPGAALVKSYHRRGRVFDHPNVIIGTGNLTRDKNDRFSWTLHQTQITFVESLCIR